MADERFNNSNSKDEIKYEIEENEKELVLAEEFNVDTVEKEELKFEVKETYEEVDMLETNEIYRTIYETQVKGKEEA